MEVLGLPALGQTLYGIGQLSFVFHCLRHALSELYENYACARGKLQALLVS